MTKMKTTSVREKDQEDEEIFLVSKLSNREGEEDEYEKDDDEEREEQEAASQAQLLSDMMKITKKGAVQQAVRTSLSTSALDTSHLLASLGPSSLKKSGHSHTLPIILEKTVAKKIKRAAGYENVAMEANKWAKVVKLRREADQLRFPLEDASLQLKAVDKVEPLQMKHPLEQEVYALLQGAKLVQDKKETAEEEAVRKALSLQEIRERNKELWRQKEMKRRYEQKARLMNKSKSRKHHRLLRREKLRKQRAQLEELQKTDAEAALECLRELEQARIEERMSLRHKTSKWAHLQGFRATRDKTAMAALQENQRMHRELTAKTAELVGSDGEDSEGDAAQGEGEGLATDPANLWTKNLQGAAKQKGSSPEDESFTKFKKFWEEVNRRKDIDRKIEEELEKDGNEKEEGDANEEEEEGMTEEKEEEEEEEEPAKKGAKIAQQEEEEEEEESKVDEKSQESSNKTVAAKEKESEPSDNKATEKNSKKKRKNKKERESITSLSDEPISVDDLLDEAQAKIKAKVQKKLKKMGVKSNEPWKKVTVKKKPKKTSTATAAAPEILEFDFTSTHNHENTDETQRRAKTLEDFESLQGESVDKLQETVHTLKKDSAGSTTTTTTQSNKPKLQVDPNKFLQVEAKWLSTTVPDNVGETGEALDDEETTGEKVEDVIREAFADDYLMEEFSSEKAEAIKKEQAGSMSLALPGWGDWTGPNIKLSNTKIKKFKLRVPHATRKDSRIGHVLYNERADVHTNLRKAMVSDLPYPFKSVKDFEASVRAPVGRLFVPEAAHKKLTAPATVTKMGAVIQPMTEDELLRHETPVRGKGKGERRYEKAGGGGSKRKAVSGAASQKDQKRKVLKTGKKKH